MAVFESTAAEFGGLRRLRLPEISVISPGLDTQPSASGLVRGNSSKLCLVSFEHVHSLVVVKFNIHLVVPK